MMMVRKKSNKILKHAHTHNIHSFTHTFILTKPLLCLPAVCVLAHFVVKTRLVILGDRDLY